MNWDWSGGVRRAGNNRREWRKKTAEFSKRKEDMNVNDVKEM